MQRSSRPGAIRMQVIGNQGLRPKRDSDLSDFGIGEQALHFSGREQSQFLNCALGDMGAEQVVIGQLKAAGEKLKKREVMMRLKRIPEIGRGDKPALSD